MAPRLRYSPPTTLLFCPHLQEQWRGGRVGVAVQILELVWGFWELFMQPGRRCRNQNCLALKARVVWPLLATYLLRPQFTPPGRRPKTQYCACDSIQVPPWKVKSPQIETQGSPPPGPANLLQCKGGSGTLTLICWVMQVKGSVYSRNVINGGSLSSSLATFTKATQPTRKSLPTVPALMFKLNSLITLGTGCKHFY